MNLSETIVKDLSPAQRQQLSNALNALHIVHTEDNAPGENYDYEGMNRFFQQLDPAVRGKIMQVYELTNTERNAPFQPKLSPGDYADLLDLDKGTMEATRNTLATADVYQGLADRMGTDASLPTAPRGRRDDVAAAVEAARPGQRMQQYADAELADAGSSSGLSLRDVIKTIIEHKGQQ